MPFAGLLPRSGGTRAFAPSGPACRWRTPPQPAIFRRPDRASVRACDGLTDARSETTSARLPGLSFPVAIRPRERRRGDPALGFGLLQGCGRMTCMRRPVVDFPQDFASPWAMTFGSRGPIRSWVFGALPARMCQTCPARIHLHGAVQRAPASPALQRISRLTPRRSVGPEAPPERLPV